MDWTAAPAVDRALLEAGEFKFSRSDKRGRQRISQRELGMVEMSLRVPGTEKWVGVKLWDFTSISFGVFHGENPDISLPAWGAPFEEGDASAAGTRLPLEKGDETEIRIQVRHHQEFRIWCSVKNVIPWKGGVKIGLRRMDVSFPQPVDMDRREGYRLPMAPGFELAARVRHPFIYGHWCRMQVSDLNKSMGFSFLCRDPSILLFEGMRIELHFELAAQRETPMIGRVAWVHATGEDDVKFGVECLDMEWGLHNRICAYLLLSRNWTPERLRDSGFRAQQVKQRLRFRSVKTMEDYAQVLHLRRDAYVGVGKKPEGTRPEQMAGALDGISRIMMAHHHDTLIGSLTFTFPVSEETLLDSQAGFPGGRYPFKLPPKANVIEVSRLCIHEEYRNTDVLQGLFEHGIKNFLMSDRHWLLTSAVSELVPAYERIGFKRLGASYRHPGLNNKEHHLILAHRNAFLYGKGMNLFAWNALFGDVVGFLLRRGLLDLTAPERLLVTAKLALRVFSRWTLERKARHAFRRHLLALRLAATPKT